jgi:hypothetical protein
LLSAHASAVPAVVSTNVVNQSAAVADDDKSHDTAIQNTQKEEKYSLRLSDK